MTNNDECIDVIDMRMLLPCDCVFRVWYVGAVREVMLTSTHVTMPTTPLCTRAVPLGTPMLRRVSFSSVLTSTQYHNLTVHGKSAS